MARITGIISFLCVVGCHLSGASPAVKRVLPGANVSLTCNLTCGGDTLWFQLHSNQLLHLLTISLTKMGTFDIETNNKSRISWRVQNHSEHEAMVLELTQMEEEDAGVYFCIRKSSKTTCVDRGVELSVQGDGSMSAKDGKWQPCFSLGICVLPALLLFCLLCVLGLYLCSGRPVVGCCCTKLEGGSQKVTEDDSMHYSSLKQHCRHQPPHSKRDDNAVIYSTVANHKSRHELRMKY